MTESYSGSQQHNDNDNDSDKYKNNSICEYWEMKTAVKKKQILC